MSIFDPTDAFSDNYFTPLDNVAKDKMDLCWKQQLGPDKQPTLNYLTNFGKKIEIPQCSGQGAAAFTFAQLCDRPLGPKDYLAIAQVYHTVFIKDIPKMTMQTRDQARRLISLVDALYECKTKVFCSASLMPNQMFEDVADGEHDRYDAMHREAMGDMFSEMSYGDQVFQNRLFTGEEELFASNRCVSRLVEMQSPRYKELQHQPTAALAGLQLDMLELGGDPNIGFPTTAFGTPRTSVASPTSDVLDRYADEISTLHGFENTPTPTLTPTELASLTEQERLLQQLSSPDNDLRPKFSDKHFWGGGWWEKIKEKINPDNTK